jgi:opacity protein-like surface antigen
MAISLRASAIVQMAVIAGALLMISTSAFAQDEPQAESQPKDRDIVLDPTKQSVSDRRQGFVLTAAAFGGFDQLTQPGPTGTLRVVSGDTTGGSGNALTQNQLPSGLHGGASAALDYAHDRDRSSIWFSGQGTTTYFPSLGRRLTSASASAQAQKQFSLRTTVAVSPSISYAPYWGLNLAGALSGIGANQPFTVQASGLNSAVLYSPTYRYAVDGMVSEQLSQRTLLMFRGATERVELPDRNSHLTSQRVGGGLTHTLSSHVALRLGYTYARANYDTTTTSVPVNRHDIDIGAVYQRTLSFSRKTGFSFATGSTLLSHGPTNGTQTNGTQQTPSNIDFQVRVDTALDHQIGQTWSARLGYRRGWLFVEGFADPFFVNDVTFNLGGRLNGRTTAATSFAYLDGSMGRGTQGSQYQSYIGSAVLRVALSRSVAAFGQYQYYRSDFSNSTVLPSGFPAFFSRNAVRGGVTLVMPPPPSRALPPPPSR